jgi:hypothetical protein
LSSPDAVREVDEEGSSAWIDFVDEVALRLGFIHYDTQGQYAGYTSQERSFPENYIEFRAKPYEQFLAAKAAKQESTLLELLVRQGQGSASEFYRQSVLGRLDGFSHWGSAVGVMPTLDFPAVRRFLLGLLAQCPSDQWLSTSALVEHLKKHDRYFLIPAKPRFKNENDARYGRYGNFHESKDAWGHEIDIHVSDPDGFERVEGRYVERFLEGIPLVLRYVDVAYARKPPGPIYPSLGCLQAFRVSDRLRRALAGRIVEPRVTVTPNFDVHVIAEAYPAGALAQLAPLCEMVSQGTTIVLKLTKQKVAAARAVSPDLDATRVLRALAGGELPANIVHELSSWSEHGEKFALYVNCSVLESDQDLPAADPFTVDLEKVSGTDSPKLATNRGENNRGWCLFPFSRSATARPAHHLRGAVRARDERRIAAPGRRWPVENVRSNDRRCPAACVAPSFPPFGIDGDTVVKAPSAAITRSLGTMLTSGISRDPPPETAWRAVA